MRQMIFAVICIMSAIPSLGKLQFKTYETTDSTFVVVFEETKSIQEAPVSKARLMNNGETYEALEIKNSYKNGFNKYRLVFQRQNVLNNTEVELTIGTKTFTEDIWKQIVKRFIRFLFGPDSQSSEL